MANEQNIRVTADSSGFRKQFEDLRKEYEKFLEDLNKNGGKFNEELVKRNKNRIQQTRIVSSQEIAEYRRNNVGIEEEYRSGRFDSLDRKIAREDNMFSHQSNRVELDDLINELREIGSGISTSNRETKDLYKVFARERLINSAVDMTSRLSEFTPLAGLNVGGIMSTTIAGYNKGENKFEKMKYGLTAFAFSSFMEGFIRSLENTSELYRTVYGTSGIGAAH